MDEANRIDRHMPGWWFWGKVMALYPKRVKEGFKRFSGVILMERV
jgi:hypothetical protein